MNLIPERRPPPFPMARRLSADVALGDAPLAVGPSAGLKEIAAKDPEALILAVRARNAAIVHQALYELTLALPEYVCWQAVKSFGPEWWSMCWTALEDYDGARGRIAKTYNSVPGREAAWDEVVASLELLASLQLVNRLWEKVFKDILPADYRRDARQLMDARNGFAHSTRKGVPAKDILLVATRLMRPANFKFAEYLETQSNLVCNDDLAENIVGQWAAHS
jgi:hypothetical protein